MSDRVRRAIGLVAASEHPQPAIATPPQVVELHVKQSQPDNIAAEVKAIHEQCVAISAICSSLQAVCDSLRADNAELRSSIADLRNAPVAEAVTLPDYTQAMSDLQAKLDACLGTIQSQTGSNKALLDRIASIEQMVNRPAPIIPPPPDYDMIVTVRDVNQRTKKVRLTPVKE